MLTKAERKALRILVGFIATSCISLAGALGYMGGGAYFQENPCGGTVVGGFCWYAGAVGQSCATVCANHKGYDTATETYAGKAGTLAQCTAVVAALWGPQTTADQVNLTPVGCGYFTGTTTGYGRVTTVPATDVGAHASGSRACACID